MIWILQNKKSFEISNTDTVLIDLDSINHLNAESSSDEFYGLIACLLSLAHPRSLSNNTGMALLSRNEMFWNLYEHAFHGKYQDIPGFCAKISLNQIIEQDYSFWIDKYVKKGDSPPWFSGLDYQEVLKVILAREANKHLSIYLIGDNGQGKSIFLKDLLEKRADSYSRVLAISNGMHDRFPTRESECYCYLGAKVTGNPLNKTKQGQKAAAYALMAYNNYSATSDWSVIQDALKAFGFSPEIYLMHSSIQSTDELNDALLASIITLPPSSYPDIQNLEQIRAKRIAVDNYQLGIKRSDGNEVIIQFSDLSSGEQNIILLILKVAAFIKFDSLILIDEPEISLHVGWQRMIPKMLENISKSFCSVVVVATHSPIIISEATGDLDHCYIAEQRTTKAIGAEDMRSIETLLFESFKTHTLNNREVHERSAKIIRESIEAANREDTSIELIVEKINQLRAMQAIVSNSKNELSGNSEAFKKDGEFIRSAISAIEKLIIQPISAT
ncbi:MAG: ATP-binding protein [Fibrobacteres bacterium]|nr:ATP-binding protein [Fibrobacterota bacterium]